MELLADCLTVAPAAELADFCSFLSPTEGEARIRKAAMKTIADAVTSIWTQATVEPFGSFVTGLYSLYDAHRILTPYLPPYHLPMHTSRDVPALA